MTTPGKHAHDDSPQFDDPAELVSAVILTLQAPEDRTNVAHNYANDKNLATEIQAYAKVAGQDWTFYVKSLAVTIGRNTDTGPSNGSVQSVDIDLGPAKVVSRLHAAIAYNIDLSCWELRVLGRNGARVDGHKVSASTGNSSTPLHSGAILDIGGTQMMFILPDSPPEISPKMLSSCMSRYKSRKIHKGSSGEFKPDVSSHPAIKSFHMFDKTSLAQSPSSASALSLQTNLDQDLSKEEAKDIKPPYSYATMITQAILLNPEGVMSLADIYTWISDHYAYYKYSKTGWQNSIRHNLSLNKAFDKVPRRPNEPGKGMKWQISDSYRQEFLAKIQSGSLLKSRRGSSVLRQLQLHLATHHNLPEPLNYYNPQSKPEFSHSRNNSAPKLPMNYPAQPQYNNNQQNHFSQPNNNSNFLSMPNSRFSGFQPPHLMYGAPLIQQNGKPKTELSSPIRQVSEPNRLSTDGTPRLPKVSGGTNLFNLPPPPPNNTHTMGSSAPQAHHSRLNSYTTSNDTGFNSSNNLHSSESIATSNGNTNNSEFSMGFTSPKKIAPLEAFTPERGSKSSTGNGKSLPNGINTNQSSPAFWNFVQFSTPNTHTPLRKNSEELNGPSSPTLGRKTVNGHLKQEENVKSE